MAAAKVTTALYRMEQGNLSNIKPVGRQGARNVIGHIERGEVNVGWVTW